MRALLVLTLLLAFASPARAEVARFALLAGNNMGAGDEADLSYAESDAEKLAEVLLEIGDVAPENLILVKGKDASTLRRALIALNDRVRAAKVSPDVEPVLFVYYSGHADADSLHLGDSEIDLKEIEQLVRGSAASYRVLVLDACRSGSLTKVKGGTAIPPFPIRIEERLDGEGVVFLTSSSANEDAQESEMLEGSFFTHYLVSGLLGAADVDGDSLVQLTEAYAYAYENTLRASSRSLIGTQHPTFQYEVRGKSDLIMTKLESKKERGAIVFPADRGFLVLEGSEDGSVVAEVASAKTTRRLSVRPGRYYLRSRGRDHLLEGTVEIAAGSTVEVDPNRMNRIEYARLVRKGAGFVSLVHGPQVGYRVRTGLWSDASLCHGGYAGYSFDLEPITLVPRVGACHSAFENSALRASADEIDLALLARHVWDLPVLSVHLGAGAGLAFLFQSFSTEGLAPGRTTGALELSVGTGFEIDLGEGFGLSTDLEAVTYVFNELGSQSESELSGKATARLSLGLGRRF